tara:strand:+ start:78 stop:254 length:177 start_codon:yes stop_codon:yes gene_type:complete
MSHPVNTELLETCYEDAYNNFMVSNKLTNDQMQELMKHEGVELAVIKQAKKLFEDLCY